MRTGPASRKSCPDVGVLHTDNSDAGDTVTRCFEEWLSMREAHQCPWCEKGPYDTVSKWRYRNGFYTYEGEVWTTVL